MPCNHKFLADLQLGYVDWRPKTLFIGTFNPEWEECNNNYAQWFYGRTQRNEFWCILPTSHGVNSLLDGNRATWIDFCRSKSLAVTDIIQSIDADVNDYQQRQAICKFKDDDLMNFYVSINDIPAILDRHQSIKQICITRRTLSDFWEECFIDMFQYIQDHPARAFQLRYLRSPSRGARRGVVGNFCQYIASRWVVDSGYEINP